MISRKTDYALRALTYLMNNADRRVSSEELSRKIKVSRVFLAKILQRLAERGIIDTWRGKGGGVRIRAKEVSLAEVIKWLEPRFALNRCLLKGHKCFMEKECRLHYIFEDMQKEMFDKLERLSISDLKEGG